MQELDRLREEISKKYPNAPESVELIREDRERVSCQSLLVGCQSVSSLRN